MMTTYETPGCAYCPSTVRACRQGESDERGLGFCPSKVDADGIANSQAELLNRAGCELNVVVGLCVGHDSLFIRHSQGLVTTLVTKDRVLAHNPVGALQLADTYYSRVWGAGRPEKLPTKPVEGRKRA